MMDIRKLPLEEADVLRGLSLLGDSTVDRAVFEAWLGGRCGSEIDRLVENGWVQLRVIDSSEKLTMRNDVGAMARNALKPDICNCRWAADLCRRLAGDLAGKAGFVASVLGKKGVIWHHPDLYERAQSNMAARLLQNILKNLDYASAGNMEFAVGTLSSAIEGDARRATCFGMLDVSLLESIIGSPRFDGLSNSNKFDAYNLRAIFWAAALGCMFISASNSEGTPLLKDAFICPAFYCSALHDIFGWEIDGDEDGFIAAYFDQARIITEKIIECSLETEAFVNSLSENEKPIYIPKVYGTLMGFVESVNYNYNGRRLLFTHSDEVFLFIDGFEERNALSESLAGEFHNEYQRFISELFPYKRRHRAESGAPPDASQTRDSPRHERSLSYYRRVAHCIYVNELDKLTEEIFGDRFLNDSDKASNMQNVLELLGLCPFEPFLLDYEAELKRNTECALSKGGADKDDLLLRCQDTVIQAKAQSILARLSPLVESCRPSLTAYCKHYAQLLMLACFMNAMGDVPGYIEKYYAYKPNVAFGKKVFPFSITTEFYDKLLSMNFPEVARALLSSGLRVIEDGLASTRRTPEDLYVICGEAAEYAERVGNPKKAEHFRIKKAEALSLGFTAW